MSDSDADIEADINTDISAAKDRGEAVSMMEPLLISEGSRHREALIDLAVELAARSAGFRRSLPEGVLAALADLVRAMNCYYSNLIEGHDTESTRAPLRLTFPAKLAPRWMPGLFPEKLD